MIQKECTKCHKLKYLSEFNYSKLGKYNRESYCIECSKIRKREWRKNNPEKSKKYREGHKEVDKKWRENNKDYLKEKNREYREKNKHKLKQYYSDNREKRKLNSKLWHKNHPTYKTEWRKNNIIYFRNYQKEYMKKKRKEDKSFSIANNLRIRLCHLIADGKSYKFHSLDFILGCTITELKIYLEKQFKPNMSWENYGEWEVDHIKPCASFNLADPEEQKKCFHYTNLQPLWKEENRRKKDKII